MLVKIIFDSWYFAMQKKKEIIDVLQIIQFCTNLPNIEIFVQALPPFTRRFSFPPHSSPRPYSLHPSSCQTPFHDFTGLEGLSPRSSTVARLAYASILRTGRGVFAEARRPTYFRRGTLKRPIGDEAFLDRATTISLLFFLF